jgi:hypothetical protein
MLLQKNQGPRMCKTTATGISGWSVKNIVKINFALTCRVRTSAINGEQWTYIWDFSVVSKYPSGKQQNLSNTEGWMWRKDSGH